MRLVVVDRADNVGLASRNVNVVGGVPVDTISIVFPVEGERPSARLKIQGQAKVASGAGSVSVLADGAVLGAADPDELGWYSLDLPAGALGDGAPRSQGADELRRTARIMESPETRIEWSSLGPWVSIDSFPSGQIPRPTGPTSEEPRDGRRIRRPRATRRPWQTYAKAAKARAVKAVEISLDDGRTFVPAKGTAHWSFRLETQDYKEGALRVIVRARYADGTTASVEAMYFLDKTPPEVEVLSPSEGGRFNGILALSGRATTSTASNRWASPSARETRRATRFLPSYRASTSTGRCSARPTWQTGLGLTFFGDNVKLQGSLRAGADYGFRRQSRELLRRRLRRQADREHILPAFRLGPRPGLELPVDLARPRRQLHLFHADPERSGLLVSSVFGQFEFPKLTLGGSGALRKFSLYTEYQLWVLSSIVAGGFIPKLSFGARISVF